MAKIEPLTLDNRIQNVEKNVLPLLTEIERWTKESEELEKKVAKCLELIVLNNILAKAKLPQSPSYVALKENLRQILINKQDTGLTAKTITLNAQLQTTKERVNTAEAKAEEYRVLWKEAIKQCNEAYEKQQQLQNELDEARRKPETSDCGIQTEEDSQHKRELEKCKADLANKEETSIELLDQLDQLRTNLYESANAKVAFENDYKSQQTLTRIAESKANALERRLKKTNEDHHQIVDGLKAAITELQSHIEAMRSTHKTEIHVQRHTTEMLQEENQSLNDRLVYVRGLRDSLIQLNMDVPLPTETLGTIVSLLPEIEMNTIKRDEAMLQKSILSFIMNPNADIDFVSLAAKLHQDPHYLQILQKIAKQMFKNPIKATQVLKAACLYTTDISFWLPEAATTTLWRWPPYYHQWVQFWLSVKEIPPPDILVQAINNNQSAERIIEMLDENAVEEGSVTMIALVVINGEECLAYRYENLFIWRNQQGEFIHVPFEDIIVNGDSGEVVVGGSVIMFESGLDYFVK